MQVPWAPQVIPVPLQSLLVQQAVLAIQVPLQSFVLPAQPHWWLEVLQVFPPVHSLSPQHPVLGAHVLLLQDLFPDPQDVQRLLVHVLFAGQLLWLVQSALQAPLSQCVPLRQSLSVEQDVLQAVLDAHTKPLQSSEVGAAQAPLQSQVEGPW